MTFTPHVYEIRPLKDRRGVDGPNAAANAIGYAMHYSRSHDAVIRVYDAAGNVIETLEHKNRNTKT
jgi:hypothetical protein